MKTRYFLIACACSSALTASAQIAMNIDAAQRGPMISNHQYGLFFEEINHAGDGGLYAELVQNRSFEEGIGGWSAVNGASLSLNNKNLLNKAQAQSLKISTSGASASTPKGVMNEGFWGMNISKDSTYTLSLWAKGQSGFSGKLKAQLRSEDGKTILGEAILDGKVNTDGWQKMTATIKATKSDQRGKLAIVSEYSGSLELDVVSLFPYTWKNRKNGLRPDLAQLLADTHPSFLRFPGGCYVEGEGNYGNAFQWKKTIGPIEERQGHRNENWKYYSSDGLGYDEYLQLCEDLGADPMFVVNIGLGHGYSFTLEETKALVQDALDAIEYANGDASTEWGRKRIANGHAAPYNLKFIEIGNENNQYVEGDQYGERYKMFYDAIKAKYPDIVCIGNVEAWGTDNPTWRFDHAVDLVDEHYYRTYQWMRSNYRKYDNVPRSIAVYNGEYAANSGNWGKYGNLNAALGEAIYMMGMERNSDVCKMASFAPIFTHEKDPRWAYDMIHFSASKNFVTPSYHVQKLMNENLGKQNLKWTESNNLVSALNAPIQVGVGSWNTQVVYDDVKVTDEKGNLVAADDFSKGLDNWTLNDGTWSNANKALAQSERSENCTAVLNVKTTGNYIYKVRAKKTGGNEGFLIMFNYQDSKNYTWWNLGGWSNTQHGVEQCVDGSKNTLATARGNIENNRWYDIEIHVNGNHVTCKLDGNTISEFDYPAEQAVYQTAQIDEEKGELIVKIANPNSQPQKVELKTRHMKIGDGTVVRLTSASGEDENSMENPSVVAPSEAVAAQVNTDSTATFEIPAYSLNVYRLKASQIGAEVVTSYPEYEKEDAGKSAYLFAHMNNSGEYTSYALSRYGQNWNDLFNGGEAIDTKANTVTGGMRDSYICRTEDGKFMLAGTDMTASLGWESNHIMDLMISPDLVHWTKNVKIDLESAENLKALGGISADDMKAAWAPQIIYDRESGNYVVYYSVGFPDRHRIYYSLVDKDLNILSEPRLYFDPGYDVIDADIVWNDVDKQYVMIYKCEQSTGFDRATATRLVPGEKENKGTCNWTVTPGFHVGENNQAIEAPTQWRPIGSDKWKLAYINYSGGSGRGYKMRDMDEHGLNFGEPTYMNGNVAAQHGSILKLSEQEYQYLLTWEKVRNLYAKAKGYYEASKDAEIGKAVALADDALNKSTTFEANVKAMENALKALDGCEALYQKFIEKEAHSGKAMDMTGLLVNPDFSQGATGWTILPNFTQANGKVAEYWNTNFAFSQTVDNLPKGEYEVSVQSFFRNGEITDAVNAHNNGTEQLKAKLFANDEEVPVVSIYSDESHYSLSPYTYPDNVTAANYAFNEYNTYNNTLKVTLKETGSIQLGIYMNGCTYSDWCCFDNFKLKYLGDPTGINVINENKQQTNNKLYNLNGQQINKASKSSGVYIQNGKKIVF